MLGAMGSGKTCLAYCFVNNNFPQRYTKTDKPVVYHKKVEVVDDGEWDDVRKPILVEVEDTPGSERGYDDDGGGGGGDSGGGNSVRRGSRVTLMPHNEKEAFKRMFDDPKYKGQLKYKQAMEGMMGREYVVKTLSKDGNVVGLP